MLFGWNIYVALGAAGTISSTIMPTPASLPSDWSPIALIQSLSSKTSSASPSPA
ncbi:hypothetical protein D3C83_224000 [compost metagenome]